MPLNYSIIGTDFYNYYIPQAYINQFSLTGTLWVWGRNNYGQLGINAVTPIVVSSPVQTIAAGTNWNFSSNSDDCSAAIKTDGTLWTWGRNNTGQLGQNNTTNRSSPIQTVAAGTNWRMISAHSNFMASVKTDGSLWAWGDNSFGQLGDNTISGKSSPVQTVASGNNWSIVAAGSDVTASVKTDGTLWVWGKGTSGQMGDNTIDNKSSPVQTIAAGTNWQQVAVGSGQATVAAIKTDGTLWTWGFNPSGAIGDNTIANKSSPVQTVAAGTNWKQVSVGYNSAAAVKTDGTLWTWGRNNEGQLGDNTTISKSSPVQTVAGGTNWKQTASGYSRVTAGIKFDGTLWTWGLNNQGGLGTNNSINRSSPVQTVNGGNNWKSVATGSGMLAIYYFDAYNSYPS